MSRMWENEGVIMCCLFVGERGPIAPVVFFVRGNPAAASASANDSIRYQ